MLLCRQRTAEQQKKKYTTIRRALQDEKILKKALGRNDFIPDFIGGTLLIAVSYGQ